MDTPRTKLTAVQAVMAQTVVITLANGTVGRFVGPVMVDPTVDQYRNGMAIRAIQFSTPYALNPNDFFAETEDGKIVLISSRPPDPLDS